MHSSVKLTGSFRHSAMFRLLAGDVERQRGLIRSKRMRLRGWLRVMWVNARFESAVTMN